MLLWRQIVIGQFLQGRFPPKISIRPITTKTITNHDYWQEPLWHRRIQICSRRWGIRPVTRLGEQGGGGQTKLRWGILSYCTGFCPQSRPAKKQEGGWPPNATPWLRAWGGMMSCDDTHTYWHRLMQTENHVSQITSAENVAAQRGATHSRRWRNFTSS